MFTKAIDIIYNSFLVHLFGATCPSFSYVVVDSQLSTVVL